MSTEQILALLKQLEKLDQAIAALDGAKHFESSAEISSEAGGAPAQPKRRPDVSKR
jgi:hypothetical protein